MTLPDKLNKFRALHGLTWAALYTELRTKVGVSLSDGTLCTWRYGKKGRVVQPHPARAALIEMFLREYPDMPDLEPVTQDTAYCAASEARGCLGVSWQALYSTLKEKGYTTITSETIFMKNFVYAGNSNALSKEQLALIYIGCQKILREC